MRDYMFQCTTESCGRKYYHYGHAKRHALKTGHPQSRVIQATFVSALELYEHNKMEENI